MYVCFLPLSVSGVLARLGGGHMKYSVPTGPPVGKHCEFCSSPHHVGGPVWIDKMHCTVRALNEPSRSLKLYDHGQGPSPG